MNNLLSTTFNKKILVSDDDDDGPVMCGKFGESAIVYAAKPSDSRVRVCGEEEMVPGIWRCFCGRFLPIWV
jgi:hypothetical protein